MYAETEPHHARMGVRAMSLETEAHDACAHTRDEPRNVVF
jgi:hypothetical protein